MNDTQPLWTPSQASTFTAREKLGAWITGMREASPASSTRSGSESPVVPVT